jgi:hypothetical protein
MMLLDCYCKMLSVSKQSAESSFPQKRQWQPQLQFAGEKKRDCGKELETFFHNV